MDATRAPIIASDTIPAAGIFAASLKCFNASTYARVGDLLSVSITRARREELVILWNGPTLVKINAHKPPIIGSKQEAMNDETSYPPSSSAELAAPPAHNTRVDKTPITGHTLLISVVKSSVRFPMVRPNVKGTRTKEATDFNTAMLSTETTVPNSHFVKKGVATTPTSVDVSVHIMLNATSPPAIIVNRLDAWPPKTHPSKTIPEV